MYNSIASPPASNEKPFIITKREGWRHVTNAKLKSKQKIKSQAFKITINSTQDSVGEKREIHIDLNTLDAINFCIVGENQKDKKDKGKEIIPIMEEPD